MTLGELRQRLDGLIAMGYVDLADEVVVEPDDGTEGAEPVPRIRPDVPGEWYVADVLSSGEGWVALLYRYRPPATEPGS